MSKTASAAAATRNLIVEVKNQNTQILVRSINIDTLKVKTDTFPCYFSNKIQRERIFQKLEALLNLKKVKGIGFYEFANGFAKLSEEFQYRAKCREFCKENGIYMLFVNLHNTVALAALSKTSTMLKEGESVQILSFNGFLGKVGGLRVNREKDRWRMDGVKMSDYPVLSPQWKEDFTQNFNPTKTFFFDVASLKQELKKDFAAVEAFFKPAASFQHYADVIDQATIDTFLHLTGEKISPYFVVYETNCNFNVLVGKQAHIHASGVVPCKFDNMAVVDPAKSVSLFMDFLPYKPKELAKEVKLSNFDTKMVIFSLTLDINSFFELDVQAIPDDMLSILKISSNGTPKIRFDEKARIVFGKQYFSVFFVGGTKACAELDSDRLEKTPIYIAFHETKPVIGRKAKELLEKKPDHVVFDLIKLASVSSAEIENPKWGFRISKEDDTLMLTMQTVDGEKSSSIDFLLAILIKDGIKRIYKTCQEKVEDIEIKFDDELTPNETLKNNILKAGKLINVNIKFA